MKILIDLTLDGYETKEEEAEACLEFVKEQLDMTASSIKILWHEQMEIDFGNINIGYLDIKCKPSEHPLAHSMPDCMKKDDE